ncbi:strictosidine synthase, putative [Ricinus communis]|uniref:Strictosidine synthase, putative n=1 Tax=Ricinus communis TaxID=3988 RepID=B9RLB4_RICCO|nr:strictosidine synthase, putative [Ricinus communis]
MIAKCSYYLISACNMRTLIPSSPSTLLSCFFLSFLVLAHGRFLLRDALNNYYYQLNLPGVLGPESLAFDCNGNGPYAGVSDGRILRWQGQGKGWVEFAITSANRKLCDGSENTDLEPICGRPLGLKFHPATCDLYVADAYFGLLKVGPNGGVATRLATSAEGVPLKFTNDLDIDPNSGVVYFTDSSVHYERRLFMEAISKADRTGRLLKYDLTTKKVSVLYRGLAFPNGVVLSKDNSYLLLVESMNFQVLKFPLSSYGVGVPHVFASLDRFPDNIRRNDNGDFWVALNTARGKLQGAVEDPVGIRFNEYGRVVQVVNGNGGDTLDSVSEIEEHDGRLWFGSPTQPYVGTLKN